MGVLAALAVVVGTIATDSISTVARGITPLDLRVFSGHDDFSSLLTLGIARNRGPSSVRERLRCAHVGFWDCEAELATELETL